MDLLYFYSPGTCALGGMVVLEWLGLPYHLCKVDRPLRATKAFKKINPWGKVPALQHRGQLIAESSAIVLHLLQQKPKSNFAPQAGEVKWDEMNQWFSYLASGFHAAFYPYYAPFRYIQDAELYKPVKEAAVEQIKNHLQYVNVHLSKNKWVLGDSKTALDPCLYAMSRWANGFLKMSEEFPAIARHQKNLEQDPALQFALALEKEEIKEPKGNFKGLVDLEKI